MDENEKYSLDNLDKYSYRVLQKMAKSLALPSNVKKIYLKELIHTKKFGTEEELESIIHQFKVDRLKSSQARKKKKIIKKLHLQGTEITSTCGTPSPTVSQSNPDQTIIQCTPDPESTFSPPPKLIKTNASPKKAIGSDRVLRSFNMSTRRPNYSILNSSVVEVFNTTRMREKERVSQSKINMTAKCVVKRIPESWEDDNMPLMQLSRKSKSKIIVVACSSLPEKRQRTVSGIYPITKDKGTDINRKYFKSINFRCDNGRVSKINAVIQKSTSNINQPLSNMKSGNTQIVLPNLTASTDTLESLVHDKPYSIQSIKQYTNQTQKKRNQFLIKTNITKYNSRSSKNFEMPSPTWHFHHNMSSPDRHYQHLPDHYANSSNYIPDQSHVPNQRCFPQDNDFPSYQKKYQDWSVPLENQVTDTDLDWPSHQRTDASNNQKVQMPSHQIQEVSSHQSLDLTTYQKVELPNYQSMDMPNYQSMDASSQTRTDVASQQRLDVPSNQRTDISCHKRTDVPCSQSMDVPSQKRQDVRSYQSMDLSCYHRKDAPNQRMNMANYQIVDDQEINLSNQTSERRQVVDTSSHQIHMTRNQEKNELQSDFKRKFVTSHREVYVPNYESIGEPHRYRVIKMPVNQKVDLPCQQNVYMPYRQKVDLPSYQKRNVQRYEVQRNQELDARYQHNVDLPRNKNVVLPSQQSFEMLTHQIKDFSCYQRSDVQSEVQRHQKIYTPYHQSVEMSHKQKVYLPSPQRKDVPSDQILDIPSHIRPSNTSVHNKWMQDNLSTERLPKINAVFSKFRDIHNMDITQPLYVQVSKESERLPTSLLKTTNVNMLETLYNFRSQFTVHQPLLKIATTNNTTCVYSTTPVMACAIPQKTASGEKTNQPLCEPVDPFELSLEPETPGTKAPEPFAGRMQGFDTEMTASNSSLNTCNSQDLDATIPEMVEDAMELISQDGDYMERLGMDVKVQCVFCEWSGSNFVIEYHIRNQHTDRIEKKEKPDWNITFSLQSLIQAASWHYQVVEQDNTLYMLCVKYEEPDWLMATIYALYDETIAQETASITIYNKVSGEPFTWEGELTHLPPNFIQDNTNCLKLALSMLNLLPNSANLEIVNGELVPTCLSKVVVGNLDLTDLQVTVFVKIFKRDVYF